MDPRHESSSQLTWSPRSLLGAATGAHTPAGQPQQSARHGAAHAGAPPPPERRGVAPHPRAAPSAAGCSWRCARPCARAWPAGAWSGGARPPDPARRPHHSLRPPPRSRVARLRSRTARSGPSRELPGSILALASSPRAAADDAPRPPGDRHVRPERASHPESQATPERRAERGARSLRRARTPPGSRRAMSRGRTSNPRAAGSAGARALPQRCSPVFEG